MAAQDERPQLQQSLLQLKEAMELIPVKDKSAYLEAMQRCPWLVEAESNPMRFLTYDRFDIWAAARRLAKYWQQRKDLFGKEAFLLPMHQTGNGALSNADLEVLATGSQSILPPDSLGRCVFCHFPSRLGSDHDVKSRMRSFFYMMSVIMELSGNHPDPSRRHEFTAIGMVTLGGYKRSLQVVQCVQMVEQLPVYLQSGHMVHCRWEIEQKTFFSTLAPLLLKALRQASNRVHSVSASSREDIADQLGEAGFRRDGIPEEFGGTFSLDEFRQWRRARIRLEMEREQQYYARLHPTRPVVGPALTTSRRPTNAVVAAVSAAPKSVNAPPKSATKPAARKRARAAPTPAPAAAVVSDSNPATSSALSSAPKPKAAKVKGRKPEQEAAHSRRKRLRRKARFMALQANYTECVEENKRLKAETVRLEMLLRDAQEIEQLYSPHVEASPEAPTHASPPFSSIPSPSFDSHPVQYLEDQPEHQQQHYQLQAFVDESSSIATEQTGPASAMTTTMITPRDALSRYPQSSWNTTAVTDDDCARLAGRLPFYPPTMQAHHVPSTTAATCTTTSSYYPATISSPPPLAQPCAPGMIEHQPTSLSSLEPWETSFLTPGLLPYGGPRGGTIAVNPPSYAQQQHASEQPQQQENYDLHPQQYIQQQQQQQMPTSPSLQQRQQLVRNAFLQENPSTMGNESLRSWNQQPPFGSYN